MKLTGKTVCLIIISLCTANIYAGKKDKPVDPEWTRMKPVVTGYYVGIGSESIYAKDYREKAKEKALADMISDIEIKIAQQSMLNRLEENDSYSEKFINNIRSESQAWLENYELTDSWADNERYYVQYRLNKEEYERLKRERLKKAATLAADYWVKGHNAQLAGRFHDAVEMYVTGIKAIEPFANERLEAIADNHTVNIAAELLNSLSGMFSTLTFHPTPLNVTVTPFNHEVVPLSVRVLSDGRPVKGVTLSAKFSKGEGHITVNGRTGDEGRTEITLSDISAKPNRRELVISAKLDVSSLFDTPATQQLGQRILASIQPLYVPINMEETNLKAYLTTDDDNSSPLLRSLSAYVATNYFDWVDDKRDADLQIHISTSFKKGGDVRGDLYDMTEYFTSCLITITDLNAPSEPVVIRVSIDDARSLSPKSASFTAARTNAQREMAKNMCRQLDRKLAEAKFERRSISTEEDSMQTETDFIPEDF